MATFTITTSQNIDELTSKAGGDTYNLNGGYLTVDQDTRYGQNANTSAAFGPITGSSTLGGTIEFKGTAVRLIPFDTGTGNVPAYNTSITKGSASGLLIGVYSALNAAPTAPAAAMPASGYIKIKQWNGVAYSSGALSGIGANATGADVAGWLEIVGVDSNTATIYRLNQFKVTGDWYVVGTTDGVRATTYQIPSNGSLVYLPGVWVETAASSGTYEFYPCAGTRTATSANIATDAVRGKYCWISTAGLLTFGNDGTNSTGAYIPPTGLKIRIPNIMFVCCTSAAKTANVLPNATLTTRYTTYANAAGTWNIDKCLMNWYFRLLNPYHVNVSNSAFMTAISLTNTTEPPVFSNVGVGQEAANPQTALTITNAHSGGTMTDCWFTRATMAAGATLAALTDIANWTFTRTKFLGLAARSATNINVISATRVLDSTWDTTTLSNGPNTLSGCTGLTFKNTTYFDHPATTTATTNAVPAFSITSVGRNFTWDGFDFGGLTMVQPYSGLLSFGAMVADGVTIKNIGTAASPLSLGAARQDDVSWSRVTTTCTVTKTAHGLKANDNVYVVISSATTPVPVGSKTVASAPTADTFTFTCTNSGATSGTLSYFPRVSGYLYEVQSGMRNLTMRRVYTDHVRTNIVADSGASVLDNITWQEVTSSIVDTTPAVLYDNAVLNNITSATAVTNQANTYGTSWIDLHTTSAPANLSAQSWSRTTTTATLTSNSHGLKTGDVIVVTVTSDSAAIVLGSKSITVLTNNTFTFTCLNAGSASGTLTYVPCNSRIGITFNEGSSTVTPYVYDSGTGFLTNTGELYMPTVGNQMTFETPSYIIGHSGFPIQEAQFFAGGVNISSFTMSYAIDKNDGNGYSSYKNLYYERTGGGGSSSSTNVTMTDTTGVAVGDYVWGTNIAPNAKVTSITNSTTVVVDNANVGTVSGTLRFNQLPSETVDAQLGFKLKVRFKTAVTVTQTLTGFWIYTTSTTASRAYQHTLNPVTVTITAKDANTLAAVSGAMVQVEATSGGALPALASVTITRSGTTATVSHTAHGLPTNTDVVIRGADQQDYNGSKRITVVDANSYTFTVANSPATPATGTITSTAQILKGTTNGSGVASTSTFEYTASQPVLIKVRKGTSATYYKTSIVSGTIGSTGLSQTVFLIPDA